MAVIFEVKDTAGNVICDLTTIGGRILGSVSVDSGNASGSISNSALSGQKPFHFVETNSSDKPPPKVSFSGTTMTWTTVDSSWSGLIRYGAR